MNIPNPVKALLLGLIVLGAGLPLQGADDKTSLGTAESNWPGINFKITFLQRPAADRLLVGVIIVATNAAPPQGTLIGTPQPIPANADPHDVAAGYYRPAPFNMTSSVLIDDLTQSRYPAQPPVAPPGKKYRPAILLEMLRPGQYSIVTLQFPVPPPPPPPAPGQPPVKQTISLLFTNAKASIAKLPIPPVNGTLKPEDVNP